MDEQPQPPSQKQLAFQAAREAGGRCRAAIARKVAQIGSLNPLTMHQSQCLMGFELAALRELVFDIACTGADGEIDEEQRDKIATEYFQRVAAFMDAEAERLDHAPLIATRLNGGG